METTGRVAEPGAPRAHDEPDVWKVAAAGDALHADTCGARAGLATSASCGDGA